MVSGAVQVENTERGFMALRAVVGVVLGLLGVVCAMVGIFVLDGISIEFPGIILGALGYYLGLTSQDRRSRQDRRSQILGIVAAVSTRYPCL
jgi:uncharacterized membrane protein YfcA